LPVFLDKREPVPVPIQKPTRKLLRRLPLLGFLLIVATVLTTSVIIIRAANGEGRTEPISTEPQAERIVVDAKGPAVNPEPPPKITPPETKNPTPVAVASNPTPPNPQPRPTPPEISNSTPVVVAEPPAAPPARAVVYTPQDLREPPPASPSTVIIYVQQGVAINTSPSPAEASPQLSLSARQEASISTSLPQAQAPSTRSLSARQEVSINKSTSPAQAPSVLSLSARPGFTATAAPAQ